MPQASADAPLRSVIICCYTEDRWELLGTAIDSAARQLGPDDELIVVVDHNPALLTRLQRTSGARARIVTNQGRRGLSDARNTGVGLASGDLVVFLDDDAEAAPGWLDALTAPFTDPSVAGVGGHAEPAWEGEAPWWLPPEFLWVVGCSYVGLPETSAEIRNPIGCNMALRRTAVTSVGGFSPALGRIGRTPVGGEETDLAIRIRTAGAGGIRLAPAATVRHHVTAERATLRYFVSRCYAEGRSKAILAGRVGTMQATEAERNYVATLAQGGRRRVGQAIEQRSIRPLAQVGVIVMGLVMTSAGFAAGLVRIGAGRLLRSGRTS